MMTTDYVTYSDGQGPILGQVLRCYVAEEGDLEGEEIAVVVWTYGHVTHTAADSLRVVPAREMTDRQRQLAQGLHELQGRAVTA